MNDAAALDIQGLGKSFTGRDGLRHQVLDDIDLTVPRGQFVCIVGASGSGKTTLIRAIGGLIAAEQGRIVFNGKTVSGPGKDRSFVFQNDSLFPWRTVMDNVLFGLQVQGVSRKRSLAKGEDLLRRVGLRGYGAHFPAELSGGMRQRVNLARALAVDPDLLLMDEPFSALDAQTREIMQRELLDIWAQQQKTVVFITHQIDEAVYLADRVLVLGSHPGRIAADIDIPFPRPRLLQQKRSPEFVAYVDRIWNLIEKDVMVAAAGSH